MQKLLLFVDRISTWVGQAFSWFIVALTLHVSWEVFSRYVLDNPRAWAFDVMIMFYGTLFMMAGAYTLAKNGHVRSEEHTSELQSPCNLVCRLLLEKKKRTTTMLYKRLL